MIQDEQEKCVTLEAEIREQAEQILILKEIKNFHAHELEGQIKRYLDAE